MKREGFTLIELTLVLFILALAAHLGSRSLLGAKSAARRKVADRQLDEIAAAVYCEKGGEPSGFLADMGRLPFAKSVPGESLRLSELYARPEGLGDFRARPASAENLADAAPAAIADPSVLVPCGWGGPYVQLPQGASRLRDPWGNPVENGGDAAAARLLDASLSAVCAINVPVAAIRHFGADGMPDAERPPASPEAQDATRHFDFAPAGLLLDFLPDTVSRVVWYAPLGDRITGGEAFPSAGASQLLLEGIAPGVRIVKIHFSDGTSRVLSVPLRAGRDEIFAVERQP